MSRAEDFKKLAENFRSSFNTRINFIGQNVVDTHEILHDANKLVKGFHKAHEVMAKQLGTDLGNFVCDLTGSVEDIRKKFRKENKERFQTCKGAHEAWTNVTKEMAKKRKTNRFKGAGK